MVRVLVRPVAIGFGLKVAVMPAGRPLTLRLTGPGPLPAPGVGVAVIVVVALEPAWTDTPGGETERLKSGSTAGVTVSAMPKVYDRLPLVPVTVTDELPVVAVWMAARVSVVPVVLDVGLKLAV